MSDRFLGRIHIAAVVVVLAFAVPVKSNPLAGFAMVDLTHSFDENTIYWPTEKDFEHDAAVEQWELEYGRVPEGATVLMNTGFSQYWPDRERYMGTAKRGAEGVAALHFPGFSAEAVTFLMEERRIVAVGLDTPSIDFGQSKDFIVHQLLFENNVIGLENLANLNALPATGAYLIALPMKIRGGSGGPLRAVGLVPTDEESQ